MSAFELFKSMIDAQKVKSPSLKGAPVFVRNLESRLDQRRKDERLYVLKTPRKVVDFSSNDFLSLSSSGLLRMAFFDELAKHPQFEIGSTGSRLLDGNTTYIDNLEREIAGFHRAETGLIFGSGYDANIAIFEVLPQPGDAVVYDELVHASIHDGLRNSRASIKRPFSHNDPNSLQAVLSELRETHEPLSSGVRTVLIAIESVYSMDGTVSPLLDMVRVSEEVFPERNYEFIIDEAHSTGLIGQNGRGLVCSLGLEDRIAVRLHTFGKGLGCTGAIILASGTVRNMLLNYAHSLIYTTAPSFPALAAARAAYTLLKSELIHEERLQQLIKYFYQQLHRQDIWEKAKRSEILRIPTGEGYENMSFVSQIVPLWTRNHDNHLLAANLQYADFRVWPIDFPVVPKDQGRVRLVFHSDNTFEQVEGLIEIIVEWAKERLAFPEEKRPWKRSLVLKEKL